MLAQNNNYNLSDIYNFFTNKKENKKNMFIY